MKEQSQPEASIASHKTNQMPVFTWPSSRMPRYSLHVSLMFRKAQSVREPGCRSRSPEISVNFKSLFLKFRLKKLDLKRQNEVWEIHRYLVLCLRPQPCSACGGLWTHYSCSPQRYRSCCVDTLSVQSFYTSSGGMVILLFNQGLDNANLIK